MIIYKLTNKINGKVYIGQTVRTLEERIKEHTSHNKTAISKAIRKYGINNFEIEIIEKCKTVKELNSREKYWIKKYNSFSETGYNLCEGGENTKGFKHREYSKHKMSVTKSKMYIGKNNPFYGKHHSKEQCEKWSKERKGRDMSKVTEAAKKVNSIKVKNIETGEVFNSIVEAAEKYNLKATHITRVCRGKRKTTGGFHWEYYNA